MNVLIHAVFACLILPSAVACGSDDAETSNTKGGEASTGGSVTSGGSTSGGAGKVGAGGSSGSGGKTTTDGSSNGGMGDAGTPSDVSVPSDGGTAGDGGASSSAGAPGTGGAGSESGTACERVCANGASLKCSAAQTCVSTCESGFAQAKALFPDCAKELDAVAECAAAQPAGKLECSEDGVPVAKDGACKEEQLAFLGACFGA